VGTLVAIEHRTAYHYDRPVRLSPHVVRLRPAPHCRTPILAYSLEVEPTAHFLNWQQDPSGNHQARFVFSEPARHLLVSVGLVADLTVINPFDFFVDEAAACYPFVYDADSAADLGPCLAADHGGPLLDAWVREVGGHGEAIIDFLVGLNRRVLADVGYTPRIDPGVQTPEETLDKGIGSCRDSAWLLVHVLRRLGLAARFVSGYLVQLAADEPVADPAETASDADARPTGDVTDLHAWAEAYVPGAGWIGLDPTSGLLAGEGHIPLACSPRPSGAAPITGAVETAPTSFEYSNEVRRVEDPRDGVRQR
jgi:transglutaminase-like putative cysteine protease